MGQSVYEPDGLAGRAMNRQLHQAMTAQAIGIIMACLTLVICAHLADP